MGSRQSTSAARCTTSIVTMSMCRGPAEGVDKPAPVVLRGLDDRGAARHVMVLILTRPDAVGLYGHAKRRQRDVEGRRNRAGPLEDEPHAITLPPLGMTIQANRI